MKHLTGIAGLAWLSACGVPATDPIAVPHPSTSAVITDVSVRADRLTVALSDGARCITKRPEEAPGNWSGVTAGCGYTLPFDVVFHAPGTPAARFLIEENPGVPLMGDTLDARVEVYITGPDGQRQQIVQPLGRGTRITTAS